MIRALVFAAALLSGDVIIVTGQSLSEGLTSSAATTTQPFSNQMVSGLTYNSSTFKMDIPDVTSWPLTPLIESSVESPRSTFANRLHQITGKDYVVITGSRGGTEYAGIKKGTDPFTRIQDGIEALGARQGQTVAVAVLIHGETDHNLLTPRATYAADLAELQVDIQAKAHASSPTVTDVWLILDQMACYTSTGLGSGHSATSLIPLAQLDAVLASGSRVVLGNPGYPYAYYATDGVHRTAAGYIAAAKKDAECAGVILGGGTKCGLYPNSVTRSAATVTITYDGNVTLPLVFDTVSVTDPVSPCKGFRFTDDTATAACSGVAISGQTVVMTLTATPTGANMRAEYAWTGTDGNGAGATTGPRGCLKDSDTDTSGANWSAIWKATGLNTGIGILTS